MNLKKPLELAIVIGVILALFLPGFLKIKQLKYKNHDLNDKNRRLQVENELLKVELNRLENDQVYQEKILREKMGVVRKNEVPVKLVPQD